MRRRPAFPALLAACFAATACGGSHETPNPRGEWRYGVVPPDLTPAPAGGGGGTAAAAPPAEAPAPPPAAPPPAAPEAPAPPAPAPTTRVVPTAPAPATRVGAYRVTAVEGGGTVRGVVRLERAVTLPPLQVTKDNDRGCGPKEQPSERLLADPSTAGVGNVVVVLADVAAGKDWPESMRGDPATMLVDQHGCRYVPHVAWTRPGTQLIVQNSDRADHNIHGYRASMKDTVFNFSSEPGTRKDDVEQAFLDVPAVYLLKCDIHPWMSGYVHVVANPYADVTRAAAGDGRKPGEFVLTEVPPGEHTLVWWKEGTVETPSVVDGKITAYTYSPDYGGTLPVTVRAGETTEVPPIVIQAR